MFRTPVGFHDAYVAAPSQKAALAAWGADSNLFAAGVAERVTDPELMREPLERPGEVVRRSRGSADEQIAALGAVKKKLPSPSLASGRGGRRARGRRPGAAAVERAERAIAAAEERHRAALAGLKAEAEAVDRRRRELERERRAEREALQAALDKAREGYRSAMEEWAG